MLGYYNYSVILTYLGALIAFRGLFFASGGHLHHALLCLMGAGFCDMFDGKVASSLERNDLEKRFGIQIDSLSDLVSFGVLPAAILYYSLSGSRLSFLPPAAYFLCALIRLAYFNVDEEERQKTEEGRRLFYLGLPVTSVALLLPAAFMAGNAFTELSPMIEVLTMLVMACAFLTPFHLKKPGTSGLLLLLIIGIVEFCLITRMGR